VQSPFKLADRKIPEPQPRHMRIKVRCGVFHSDSFTKLGLFLGIQYPRVPGHEVVGIVDVAGADVPLVAIRPTGLALGGTAVIGVIGARADAVIWSPARTVRFLALLTMAVMPIT
jgi:D-arabinose 1-dehydrogenase-like Zn-dependent alcohol dehydrogenase